MNSGERGVRLLFASPGGGEVADAIMAAPWSSSASAASTVGRESTSGIAPWLPSSYCPLPSSPDGAEHARVRAIDAAGR